MKKQLILNKKEIIRIQRDSEKLINYLETEKEVSNCCGTNIKEETDICLKCGEHCETISEEEFFEQKEQVFTIGKVRITKFKKDNCIMLSNDDEGMIFTEKEFKGLLKELLYKHF